SPPAIQRARQPPPQCSGRTFRHRPCPSFPRCTPPDAQAAPLVGTPRSDHVKSEPANLFPRHRGPVPLVLRDSRGVYPRATPPRPRFGRPEDKLRADPGAASSDEVFRNAINVVDYHEVPLAARPRRTQDVHAPYVGRYFHKLSAP